MLLTSGSDWGRRREDGGEAGLSDVLLHERPGATLLAMTAAGHDSGNN